MIQEYLKGYKGILVTDGYQPYHTIMKYSDDIIVAGCWAHTRRMYTEIVKAAKKDGPLTPAQKIAAEAVKRIDQIYHNDNKTKGSSDEVRLKNRKEKIKPLVDDFFAWVKTHHRLCQRSKSQRILLQHRRDGKSQWPQAIWIHEISDL